MESAPANDAGDELRGYVEITLTEVMSSFQLQADQIGRKIGLLGSEIDDLEMSFEELVRRASTDPTSNSEPPTTSFLTGLSASDVSPIPPAGTALPESLPPPAHSSFGSLSPSPAPPLSPIPSAPIEADPTVRQPRKKAVLVGINYLGLPNMNLAGCINDVNNEKRVLRERFGFREENMRMLTDDSPFSSRPTKNNILSALNWLFDGARKGDTLFFAYSGHGTQFADEGSDEVDGKDEALCPLDTNDAPWPNNLILDDELNDIFMRSLPSGVKLVCVFDCCHSATVSDLSVTRDLSFSPRSIKSRFLPPPPQIQAKLPGRRSRTMRSMVHSKPELGGKLIWTLSGCQDHQTSADARINGMSQGAMTWSLLKALADSNYSITYNNLISQMRQNLAGGGYSQNPAVSTTSPAFLETEYLA